MGERRPERVLSKYAPPGPGPGEVDLIFNSAQRRQPNDQPIKVRMHRYLPMPLRCDKCRNYIYQRTKVNACKECCIGEIKGSSELVLNPTDVLTKTNGPESANKEGNKHSALSTTVNPCKKQKSEPTAGLDNREELAAEENSITTIE